MIITNQTISIKHLDGEDKYGEPIYNDPIDYKARVTDTIEKVRNQFGDEVISTMHFLVKGLVKIGYEDEITYVNENNDTFKRLPISYEPKRGFGGKTVYTKVYC